MIRKLLLALFLVCVTSGPAQAGIRIVAGIEPVKFFVEQIGGDLVEVSALVGAGADPHTYEPKPSQMRAVTEADLLFAVGIGFERNWIPRFKSANTNLRVVHLDKGITKIPMVAHANHDEDGEKHHVHGDTYHDEHAEELHGHDHGDGMDPHIWTSPRLVKQMAATIVGALLKVDPGHKQVYQANHDVFVKRVDALNQELKEILGGLPDHAQFMVYHPAWGYFAKEYHLKQLPVEMEGKAPGPRQLVELIRHAKKHHIKVMFVQPQFSKRAAQTIAKEIGGQVVEADPLAYDWLGNLRRVGGAFRAALE